MAASLVGFTLPRANSNQPMGLDSDFDMKKSIFRFIFFFVIICLLAGCAGSPKPYRNECDLALEQAWQELSIAEAEGFAGTVSYSKAIGLLTAAKSMQVVENFDNCYQHAQDARYYISESRQGR